MTPGGENPKGFNPLSFSPPDPSPFLNPDWGARDRRTRAASQRSKPENHAFRLASFRSARTADRKLYDKDQMEQDGIVGPSDGSKPRSVIR